MPLLWISIAFIAGTVLALNIPINGLLAAVSSGVVFGFAILESRICGGFPIYKAARKRIPLPLLLLAAAFLLGMVRGETGKPDFNSDQLGYYNGSPDVIIRGMASQPAEEHDKSTMLTIKARDVAIDGSTFIPVSGEAMVLLPAGSPYEYGDRLAVMGDLEIPPERDDFSYKQYLENRGVFSYLSYPRVVQLKGKTGSPLMSVIYRLRDRIAETVEDIIPQPEAGFLAGMLVGRDETIPDDIQKAFKSTGTSHLVAISGFNITLLSGLILALTNRLFPRMWSVGAAVILLTGYTLMAGASPSVVRAAIMGGLAIVGRSIGRTRTAVNSLGLASVLMIVINPLILRDIGFQLSVAATAGILLIGGPLNDRFLAQTSGPDRPVEINRLLAGLGESVLVTLAAQIATLPFLLYHFEQYPLIGLLVNPFVLPAQPPAMMLGMAAAVAGMIYLPLGRIIGLGAWLLLAYTTRMVDLFSRVADLGLINLHLDWWQAGLLGAGLLLAYFLRKKWANNFRRYTLPIAFLVLGSILGVVVNLYLLSSDGNLHIDVFRQGNDLSTFITTPGGQHLLITNRPGDKDLIAFADRRLPVSGKRLDALILPNPSATTVNGLSSTVGRFNPKLVLMNSKAGGKRVQSNLDNELTDYREASQLLVPGRQYDLGRGAILETGLVDEEGTSLVFIWGNTRYAIQYGTPAVTDLDSIEDETFNVVVLDHTGDLTGNSNTNALLSAEPVSTQEENRFNVPDGGWLEVFSDGENTSILEKADDHSG